MAYCKDTCAQEWRKGLAPGKTSFKTLEPQNKQYLGVFTLGAQRLLFPVFTFNACFHFYSPPSLSMFLSSDFQGELHG